MYQFPALRSFRVSQHPWSDYLINNFTPQYDFMLLPEFDHTRESGNLFEFVQSKKKSVQCPDALPAFITS
jgi:hypothetical protein